MPSTIEVKIAYDSKSRSYGDLKKELVDRFERQLVEMTLTEFGGNMTAAARSLSMDRKHLHSIAKKHGLR